MLLLAILLAGAATSQAQLSVNVNIGTQPVWGPVGYDYVENYYIPDIDAYYYVPTHEYVYYEGGTWVRRRSLPPQYRNIDIYHVHKVVINERDPWMRNERYRNEYGRYRGVHDQQIIRDSRDQRYYANPRHPQHAQWKGNNGNHYGNGGPRQGQGPRQVEGPRQGPGPGGNHGHEGGGHDEHGGEHGGGHGEHGGGHGDKH